MDYGIQLYSVRDLAEQDLEAAVRQMASLGYTDMEFAGFFGRSAEQVTAMLRENGVRVCGTHSGLDDLWNHFDEVVAYHKAIGNRNYIIPGHDLSSQDKLDGFVDKANRLIERLAAEGITLAYHNHAHEFVPNRDGSVIFEQLLYRTGLKFEVDTFWAYVGMKEPLLVLERLRDRLLCIHIKDGFANGEGRPLGQGDAPVEAVWDWCRQRSIPMVVESETLTPDGPTEAAVCIAHLRALEQKAGL